MSALEKLKKAGNNLVSLFDWVGSHLTGILTIFSVVVGFLFLQQRKEKQSLETDLELKDKTTKVENDTKEVEDATKQSKTSGAAYDDAKREYDASRGKP